MERCYNEKEYKSKKIDLTLKLSPCGENAEEKERGLRRSSSSSLVVVGVANGAQWGTSLGRSCSLPAERQRRVAALSPQVLAWVAASSAVNVNNTSSSLHKPNPLPSSSQDSGLQAKGVALNIQTSTKEENDSKASHKTIAKAISPRPADSKPENPAKKHKLGNYCSLKGDVMEILRQMPSVTTTGDGPNGKRIEGFLYKYRSGQVCIVCVCHGNFLTPAEFVMHAGGKEVANPMKHITVLSNSF
uniref:Ninja-family protein n=1 Tax=Glycine max TaxID=3847 RepID=I1KD20_SOYBN